MSELELRDEEVVVTQYRGNNWLEEGHDGEFRYTRCFEEFPPFVSSTTGMPITGITEEEARLFENKIGLSEGDLSAYNIDYWSEFMIRVPKDGLRLNLIRPKDLLMYKVLLAHPMVANSEVEKDDSPFAEYVLTSTEQKAKVEASLLEVEMRAFDIFNKMSIDEMASFLKIYGNRPGANASKSWITSEIGKVLKSNPEEFIRIAEDPNYDMKVFISDCVAKKALVKNKNKYSLQGGDPIGYSLEEAIEYLKSPEYQEVYISLKDKVRV